MKLIFVNVFLIPLNIVFRGSVAQGSIDQFRTKVNIAFLLKQVEYNETNTPIDSPYHNNECATLQTLSLDQSGNIWVTCGNIHDNENGEIIQIKNLEN